PYWFHYYTVHLLAYVTGVEVGNKIFLTFYALGLPLGALALARQFGRSPHMALFTFPLVWNFNLADGFIAYSSGVALLPLGLILVDRHAERPSIGRGLAVFAFGTGLYFVHLLPYLMFLVLGGVVALLRSRPRAAAERLIPVIASALIGAWAFGHAEQMHFHSLKGEHLFAYRSLVTNLGDTPLRLLDFLTA